MAGRRDILAYENRPTATTGSTPTGWRAVGYNFASSGSTGNTLTAYVVCAEP
jgi:hypothetical protein